jgi:hypothetical protein
MTELSATGLGMPEAILGLPLDDFIGGCEEALPPLVDYLLSSALREHPRWGQYFPFDQPEYSDGPSPGYACRPDILLTDEGPKITELDFVAACRGLLVGSLPSESDQRKFLEPFAGWYSDMGADSVYYATGSVTDCRPGCEVFAGRMRELLGFDIESVNIDTSPPPPGTLIDRLFYRSELAEPFTATKAPMVMSEPWVDSKMVFAMIHDAEHTEALEAALGRDNLAFLRETLIPSRCLDDIQSAPDLSELVENKDEWLIKSSRVEVDACWGGRSVILGQRCTSDSWEETVSGRGENQEVLGKYPIVQPFIEGSKDLGDIAKLALGGDIVTHRPGELVAFEPTRKLFGVLRVFFLLDTASGNVNTPPYGLLNLRQDPVTAETADSIVMPVVSTPAVPER